MNNFRAALMNAEALRENERALEPFDCLTKFSALLISPYFIYLRISTRRGGRGVGGQQIIIIHAIQKIKNMLYSSLKQLILPSKFAIRIEDD